MKVEQRYNRFLKKLYKWDNNFEKPEGFRYLRTLVSDKNSTVCIVCILQNKRMARIKEIGVY